MKQRLDQSQFDALPPAHRARLIAWLEAHDYTRPGMSEYGIRYVVDPDGDCRQASVTIGTLLEFLADGGYEPDLQSDHGDLDFPHFWKVTIDLAGLEPEFQSDEPLTALWSAVGAVLALEAGVA